MNGSVSGKAYEAAVMEAKSLIGGGNPQGGLNLIENGIKKRKVVGPEHALQVQALCALDRKADAAKALKRSASLKITTGDAADALAFFARHLDLHDLANRLYKKAVDLEPSSARFRYNFATSEMALGNLESAADAADKALKLDPRFFAAALMRSEASRATENDNHLAELRDCISRAGSEKAAIPLYFALGKELHELRQYDEAFSAFARGSAARRQALNYNVATDEQKMDRIREVFVSKVGTQARQQDRRARHIFIIGLPRSGTTLTERILGALPQVRSNNETNNFSSALMKHAATSGGDVFDRAARADFDAVGRHYEALAASDAFKGSIIEKLPFNYLYVGAILQSIPDAAIISLKRHPMDSCFAMYRTLFNQAYPFSYSFDELARYYAAYDRLMRHWENLFPGRMLTVQYEELVSDPGEIAQKLAAYCGLPWKEGALELSQNRSASLTASAAQVRGGIYTTSAGIWEKYGKHLEPLAEALRAQGVEFTVD